MKPLIALALAGVLGVAGSGAAQPKPDLHRRALTWGTYIGGQRYQRAPYSGADDVAVDSNYSTVLLASTNAADMPIKNAFQAEPGGDSDVYVAKINQDQELVYATYLGYDEKDYAADLTLDAAGNAYITGWTFGPFPSTEVTPQPCNYDQQAAFVTKLSPRGEVLYSKCIDMLIGDAIAVDSEGSAYVTGEVDPDTSPGTRLGPGGTYDIGVYKLDPTGTTTEYRTLVGGSGNQGSWAIEVDEAGAAYVGGTTTSEDFPTVNAVDDSMQGDSDGVQFKLTPDGQSLEFSTYIGEAGGQDVTALAVGDGGSVYLTAADYPNDDDDPSAQVLYAHVSADGSEYLERSFLGGNHIVTADSLALGEDAVFVGGGTQATDLQKSGGLQPKLGGAADGYLAQIDRTNGLLMATTYYGGSQGDSIDGVALDPGGALVVAGSTGSPDLALAEPMQSRRRGVYDIFLFHLTQVGADCTILGGAKLFGTVGRDLICAGPGNDKVTARGGADEILGGKGSDVLRGGSGRDSIVGGPGRDRCDGERETSCEG